MDLVKAKIEQATEILRELDIDLWMIFLRESDMMADPALDLVVGHKVVWQSAFFISKSGETMALVGNYDAADFERSGRFKKVRPYIEDCGKEIRKAVEKFDPGKLALNYSTNDIASDGLSHGMYLLLMEYLKGTPYTDRVISSEQIISLLREMNKEKGVTVMAATHDLKMIDVSDRIVYLRDGLIDRYETRAEVYIRAK